MHFLTFSLSFFTILMLTSASRRAEHTSYNGYRLTKPILRCRSLFRQNAFVFLCVVEIKMMMLPWGEHWGPPHWSLGQHWGCEVQPWSSDPGLPKPSFLGCLKLKEYLERWEYASNHVVACKKGFYVYLRMARINAKFILHYSGRAPESDQIPKTTQSRRNIVI